MTFITSSYYENVNEETAYHVAFSHFHGIGPITFGALYKQFGSAKQAYRLPLHELRPILGDHLTERFGGFRTVFNPMITLDTIYKKGIEVLSFGDASYPKTLKRISDPPICLYVKGKKEMIDFEKDVCLSVVGTRKPTSYGQYMTRLFSGKLVERGFIIVSGLAMGVDTIAHQTALEKHGKTIAVLGCGVDIVYPQVNHRLYHEIIQRGGIVVSEFPPKQMVKKGLFVARNRLISALSIGVLITEGADNSGSLITARYAAEQGREVFALPGPVSSAMSEAPNNLIKQGAKLVTKFEDIMEEFGIKKIHVKNTPFPKLSVKEKSIYNLLFEEAKSADDLLQLSGLSVAELSYILSTFEISGLIEKNSEGKYQALLTG
ncbi:MAG: DNA-processing protein DprA [Patescibacteria group bacterium]